MNKKRAAGISFLLYENKKQKQKVCKMWHSGWLFHSLVLLYQPCLYPFIDTATRIFTVPGSAKQKNVTSLVISWGFISHLALEWMRVPHGLF
jgi:hypothetical protein